MARQHRSSRTHVIRNVKQLQALRTPTRHRVLNAILELGRCSVKELADRLAWKPESLYYHVKALREAGIVRQTGTRPGGRRPEALYEAVASEVKLDESNRSPTYLAEVRNVYRAALRAAERNLERGLQQEAKGRGQRGTTLVQQFSVRLSSSKTEQLRRMLDEVSQFVADNDDPATGETVSLTIAVSRIGQR